MKKLYFFVALFILATTINAQKFTYPDAWGKTGFTLSESKTSGVQVVYSVPSFSLNDFTVNGQMMKEISLPGAFLPNDEGMPNLPGQGRYIAIPQGSTPRLEIVSMRTEILSNVEIIPSPNLPAENDDSPQKYVKNQQIYSKNAYYPAEPIKISEIQKIRGVDVVLLGVTPFQYNPVTKELKVFHDVKVNIVFDGGNGHFGNDLYRSKWFDPILSDALLNYSSLPKIDYAKRFQSYSKSVLDDECEYIIISPTGPDFLAWADSVKNFRSQQGILTKIFTVDQVGGNSASAIELWIDNVYNTWTIKPVAVLMFGDFGSDITKNVTSPIVTMKSETFPSDHKLADVDNDNMAEIVFARIVANNNTQLTTICSKFLDYERNPQVDTSYYQHPITALGWQTERWFQLCSEIVGGYFRTKGKFPVRINKVYQGTPGSVWSSATNTSSVVSYFGPNGLGYIPSSPNEMPCCWDGGSAAQINTAINDGAFLLQHRDHGEETGWGEPSYHNYNIDQLTNTNRTTFVMSINCLTGKYNWSSECFGERFIRHTKNGMNAGALGIVCPSEVSYSFVNDTFVWGMYDNMWSDFMPEEGTEPESRGACPAFGMVAGKYFLQQSSWPYNGGDKQITYFLFHMHGDAFLRLYDQVPQAMSITHDQQVMENATVFNITANEGADIALTVNNQIIAIAVAEAGPTAITIPPQTAGTNIMVTVTKQNFFRYSAVVPVISLVLIPEFAANVTNVCINSDIDFTDMSTGNPTSWEWSFEGGTPATSTARNPEGISYTAAGNYGVTLTVHREDSVKTITKAAYIHVMEPPVAAFAATEPCVGNETSFTDQSTGNGNIISWFWTFGDPASGSADTAVVQNPVHTYSAAGNYNVTLTVNNPGCANTIDQQAQVLTTPEVATTPSGDAEVCASSVNQFTTEGALYATSYEWQVTPAEAGTFNGNEGTSELTVSGTYTGPATITVRGINECDNGAFSEGFSINIKALAAAPSKPAGADTVDVNAVTTSDFTITALPEISTYEWSLTPAEVGSISGTGTTGTVTWVGTYQGGIASVTVKGVDDCGPGNISEVKTVILKNSLGIGDQASAGIEVYPNPTSGKINLKITGGKTVFNLNVINTIGSVVYTEKNISLNESLSRSLDLSALPDGVYFLKAESSQGMMIKKIVIRK